MSMSYQWKENRGAAARVKSATKAGLRIAGEHILGVSNRQVPHEEGDLERSGVVSEGDNEVAISYDTPYAVRQHEDLSMKHDAGRNAKYLERACKTEASTAGRLIATHIKRTVG